MDWLLQNWMAILGGGSITTLITWLVNRNNNKADLLTKVSGLYDGLFDDLKTQKDELKEINKEYANDIRELRTLQNDLQSQFNALNIAYTREVERSENWEKLHRELTEKYNLLEKDYEILKTEHDKLKKDFDQYKKANK
jgi:chromosome segregation ATPase